MSTSLTPIAPARVAPRPAAGSRPTDAGAPASAVDQRRQGEANATPSHAAAAAREPSQDAAAQREVARLAARDREVRAHEQAHLAAGGSLVTSGPSYSYQRGPDGRRYAVGGEVGLDVSPVRGDPEATLVKAARIRAAALAPAEPSAQDQRVAARASEMAQQARGELARRRLETAEASYTRTAAGEAALRPGLLLQVRA